MKNSLEIIIKQVRLEGGFKRGGRIRVAAGFQARSKDQEILEGGGAGPSTMPRRDHE